MLKVDQKNANLAPLQNFDMDKKWMQDAGFRICDPKIIYNKVRLVSDKASFGY